MIAKIAVAAANFAIDKPYSYMFPQEMQLQPGVRVIVPFGRGNKPTEGVVLQVESGDPTGLKSVVSVLDEEPLLNETMLRLAAFMHERYFCTFYDAIRAMLPVGYWFQANERYSLTEDRSWENVSIRQEHAQMLLKTLSDLGGEAAESTLREVLTDEADFHKAMAYLIRKKWVRCETSYKRKSGDKTEKVATLAVSAEEAMAYASSRPKSAAMQKSVLETLCAVGSASVKELCYYTGASVPTIKRLENLGFLELSERSVLRCREIKPANIDGPLELNAEQQEVFLGLTQQMQKEKPGAALLYGVTGSGKTSVYLKLIDTCLQRGKSAVLLVPEIALTPQLLGILAAHFGDLVAVLHSSLPAGERYDQWKRIRDRQARVVVGTRSAVFAPCKDLGLLILDEEQEHSYKSENSPRYAAREIAVWRGLKEGALVLMGSATPSVETMYHAKNGDYTLYTLRERYNGKTLPEVEIVDMREELKEGNDLSLSYPLLDAIGHTAKQNKQAILFLNRRGNSKALVCVDCREAPECPRCSARLTYHSANERLMCHYCGFSQHVPAVCPTCGGTMKRVGAGTQKVQLELEEMIPNIRSARMDADTVSAVNTHEQILEQFQKDNTTVLIGTQMVAKGLNLPNVTLVGVLDADLSLYNDSYRAAETTFNLLTQVVGRAGRGEASGRAMIQTMVPNHRVIELAARQDYDAFYDLEIGLRRVQGVPPFGDVAQITFTGQDEATVLRGATKFRDSLKQCLQDPVYEAKDCAVLGPAPCPVPKINYNFRYRITLRCSMDRSKRALLAHLLRQFSMDRENRSISAFADINGYD